MLLVAAIFSLFSVHAHQGEKHVPKLSSLEKIPVKKINRLYQSQVKPLIESKCLSCHGTLEKMPWYYYLPGIKQVIQYDFREAKEHLDMRSGFPFKGHGAPREDLLAIKKSIEKESMPPLRFRLLHWDSQVTPQEKEVIFNWIETSLKLMEKKPDA